jgi:NAD-dependent dihydropyrimidine dehydrogenase PreA subunit
MAGEIKKKIYALPNRATPSTPITIDEKLCNGCNNCVDICTTDILMPNPIKGKAPVMLYPEECWYAGCCIGECPTNAIKLNFPLMARVHWQRKDTGEISRV